MSIVPTEMNKIKILQIVLVLTIVLITSCEKEPERSLHPETLVGSLELLSSEKTGIAALGMNGQK